MVSKTFTTLETLTNALHARRWLVDALGDGADVGAHFLTVSTRARPDERFASIDGRPGLTFWDWVGGRYSVWSAAGAAAALYLGYDGFEAFLAGGAEMDAHFETAPLARNAPVLAALLGVWNSNLLGFPTQRDDRDRPPLDRKQIETALDIAFPRQIACHRGLTCG